jgi:hypothetical protein
MCSCGSSRPSNPTGGGSPTPPNTSPPSATQQCPLQNCCGQTRWIDTQAYCGDNARLEGTITGSSPPSGPVTVEILHPTNGSVVDTVTAQMNGGHFTATWVCKAQSANWRTDRHRFRFTAAGLTCTSSNEFTFRQRPTTNWILKDVDHPTNNGFAPVVELHDARLEANRVHYSLKLRTHGSPFDATKQANAKSRIETVWNDGFNNKKFHRTRCGRGRACNCAFDCCKAGFRLDVNFVASGEHVAVNVVASPPPPAERHRSGMGRNNSHWGDPPRNETSTYAHEVGHVLGQFDEYSTGGTDPSGVQPANAPDANLMSTTGNTTLLNRHYRRVLAFLNANASGDPYEIIPP